jgi:hypothetical protein
MVRFRQTHREGADSFGGFLAPRIDYAHSGVVWTTVPLLRPVGKTASKRGLLSILGLCYHGAVENQLVLASVDYGCDAVKTTDAPTKTEILNSSQIAVEGEGGQDSDASQRRFWYSLRMSKHRSRGMSESITGIAEATAERVRLGSEILNALAQVVAANEEAQRRFRTAVLIRLSRIETITQMIHGAQIAVAHMSEPASKEKMASHGKYAEDYVSRHSQELGLKMVKFVYGGIEALDTSRKKRRNRSDCLSYEI